VNSSEAGDHVLEVCQRNCLGLGRQPWTSVVCGEAVPDGPQARQAVPRLPRGREQLTPFATEIDRGRRQVKYCIQNGQMARRSKVGVDASLATTQTSASGTDPKARKRFATRERRGQARPKLGTSGNGKSGCVVYNYGRFRDIVG